MPYGYLCHLETRLGNPNNRRAQAQHYIGHCVEPLASRMWTHQHDRQNAAAMLYYAFAQNIAVTVVRTWWFPHPAPWLFERGLKALKKGPLLCPRCNPEGWRRYATDAQDLLTKGIAACRRRNPDYVPPPDAHLWRMAQDMCEIPVADAWHGRTPDGTLLDDNPFESPYSDAELRRQDAHIAIITMRRRQRGPAPLIRERLDEEHAGDIPF